MQTIEELASKSIPSAFRMRMSDTAICCVESIAGQKGQNITIIELSELASASAQTYIVCSGKSTTQVRAIADNIREYVQIHTGRKPDNYIGYRNCQWIAIDYGDVIAHIFLPDTREFYNIEELWSDAPHVTIPNIE